jgi:hypothetical protein
MSNQRPGKFKPAAMSSGIKDLNTRNFFRTAREVLEEYGHEDAAFYFAQVEEVLNEGKTLPSSKSEIARVLGV